MARAIVLVLDSFGVGATADADSFGIEIEFWDASTFRSMWVGKTDTYDAGSVQQSVNALADVVVAELQSKGML